MDGWKIMMRNCKTAWY